MPHQLVRSVSPNYSIDIPHNFLAAVIAGEISDMSILRGFGERESMGTTATGEDIWRGNELTPAPTSHTSIPIPAAAGEQMTVVSESANDADAGTGINTLDIHYIDAAGDAQSETVTMDGTTEVDTTATDIRFVQHIHARTVGSAGVADGHVKIYKKGSSGLVYNMIHVGGNMSLVPNRMVPAGKNLLLMGWHCSEAQSKRVAFRLRSTDVDGELLPGVFCFKDVVYLNGRTMSINGPHALVPSLSIVKISGWPDAIGAEGSCSWWGVLLDV